MKYLLLPALCSLLLSVSCKKNNDKIIEGDFAPVSIAVSDVRMFTAGGEVKDLARILDHINRRDLQLFFTFQKEEDPNKYILALQLKNGKAVFINKNNSASPEMSYTKTGETEYRINWVSPTPIILPAYAIENKCGRIGENIYRYPMQKLELTPVPASSGMSWSFKPAYDYIFGDHGGVLDVPLIAYSFSSSNPLQGCSTSAGDNWNYFDEKVTDLLDTGDTLVVQSKTMLLIRK